MAVASASARIANLLMAYGRSAGRETCPASWRSNQWPVPALAVHPSLHRWYFQARPNTLFQTGGDSLSVVKMVDLPVTPSPHWQ